jgi:hypothetical protein
MLKIGDKVMFLENSLNLECKIIAINNNSYDIKALKYFDKSVMFKNIDHSNLRKTG